MSNKSRLNRLLGCALIGMVRATHVYARVNDKIKMSDKIFNEFSRKSENANLS